MSEVRERLSTREPRAIRSSQPLAGQKTAIVRARKNSSTISSLVEILDMVRSGTANTRQELEQKGEFGRAIVADRLNTLSDLGLVDENETGTTSGGRAPRLVRFAKDRARLVVITLEQSAIGIGLADLSGVLLTEHHQAFDLATGSEQTINRIRALIRWVLSRQKGNPDLWGISISVPGLVPRDISEPFLLQTPPFMPNWNENQLVESLINDHGVPVWVSSSVETMTMGELHGGEGIDTRSMVFVRIGNRITAGLAINGNLYRGSAGAAGLIGQLPVDCDGKTGSLDGFAGSENILRQGIAAAKSGHSHSLEAILKRSGEITLNDVCQAAQIGDPVCNSILMNSGRLIGGVIATIANMLNPQLIVLAGTPAQTNDILLAAVREAVYGASHPLVTRDLKITRSQMGTSAGLLGAASVGVEALFEPLMLRDWLLEGSPTRHPSLVAIEPSESRKPD